LTLAYAERNPDGSFTDHGKLKVKAAQLIAENIHGYDKGILREPHPYPWSSVLNHITFYDVAFDKYPHKYPQKNIRMGR